MEFLQAEKIWQSIWASERERKDILVKYKNDRKVLGHPTKSRSMELQEKAKAKEWSNHRKDDMEIKDTPIKPQDNLESWIGSSKNWYLDQLKKVKIISSKKEKRRALKISGNV